MTLAVIGFLAPAKADVVDSNFGPGNGIDISVGYAIYTNPLVGGRQDVAVQFTVGPTSFSFTSAEMALRRTFGTVNLVNVVLFSNSAANTPGTALQSIAFTGVTTSYSVTTVYAIAPLTLNANTSYLLAAVAADGTRMDWARTSDVNDIGFAGVRDESLIWRSQSGQQLEAFRINGEPIIVPEPSTLTLLGIGTLSLFGSVRRRRSSRKA